MLKIVLKFMNMPYQESLSIRVPNPQFFERTNSGKSDKSLLLELKKSLGIRKVFYPGSWDDIYSLEPIFKTSNIVYMDCDQDVTWDLTMWKHRNLVVGNMKYPPFPDQTFDLVFLQDSHLSLKEFRSTLRTLKTGGALIYSTHDCGNRKGMQLEDVARKRVLKRLPIKGDYYVPFLKRG